jgi:hypothetical protein
MDVNETACGYQDGGDPVSDCPRSAQGHQVLIGSFTKNTDRFKLELQNLAHFTAARKRLTFQHSE